MRLVLDSNATVSRYISPSGAPAEIFRQWELGTFDIVVSDHVLAEYRRALGYPRVRSRHHMDEDEIEMVVEAIRARAIVVASTTLPAPVCVDPDDDRILACAVAGDADFVVSRDLDLLRVGEYEGIRIVSPADMLSILRGQ